MHLKFALGWVLCLLLWQFFILESKPSCMYSMYAEMKFLVSYVVHIVFI